MNSIVDRKNDGTECLSDSFGMRTVSVSVTEWDKEFHENFSFQVYSIYNIYNLYYLKQSFIRFILFNPACTVHR